jgi:hypothetical protein
MCSNCNQPSCNTPNSCYEARLSLGLNDDKTMIVGTLDGLPIIPIPLKQAIRANETNTTLKWDDDNKMLVYQNERFKNDQGSADFVSAAQILSGAQLSQIGGIDALVEGGLASVIREGNELVLTFEVPQPVANNELSEGFIAYVPEPVSGSRYKIIKPAPGGDSDTLLVGHPNGSIEFVVPITSPLLVPLNTLTSNGEFSGVPAVHPGNDWGYQTMGTTQVVTNTSGSDVEVTLRFRYSMQTAGTRNGVYCTLINGGSDFKTTFIEGVTNLKQEGYPGGMGQFSVILEPNQKCQFEFGGWSDDDGAWELTIGSTNENGTGTPTEVAVPPTITIRRQV